MIPHCRTAGWVLVQEPGPAPRAQRWRSSGWGCLPRLALGIPWVRATHAPERTHQASRFPRDAHGGTEVHKRLIEIKNVAMGHECLGEIPQPAFHRVRLRTACADEDTKQHARDI